MIAELSKKLSLDDDAAADVRVCLCHGNKINKELSNDFPVASILDYSYLIAERMPKDDSEPAEGDRLIWAYHFDKEPKKTYGIPFTFHLKPAETLRDAKVRLSKRTGIKGKQLDNVKFAFVSKSSYSKPTYLGDGKWEEFPERGEAKEYR